MKGWIFLFALVVGVASAIFAFAQPSYMVEAACTLGASVLVIMGGSFIG
jgi:hypothetical protein